MPILKISRMFESLKKHSKFGKPVNLGCITSGTHESLGAGRRDHVWQAFINSLVDWLSGW